MNEKFVVVWRAVDGAAVQTYAQPDKTPQVFSDGETPETARAEEVGQAQLTALLENREAFQHKRVPVALARKLLGWDV